jgi:hypothetical protein
MIKGVNYMMMMRLQAAPLVRKGRVEQFMDPKLGTQYPPARALKVFYPYYPLPIHFVLAQP